MLCNSGKPVIKIWVLFWCLIFLSCKAFIPLLFQGIFLKLFAALEIKHPMHHFSDHISSLSCGIKNILDIGWNIVTSVEGHCNIYHETSNICAPNLNTKLFLVSSCSCICLIHWIRVLSREWRCSWSAANRQCSNYIWVISKFISY